MRHHKAGKKLGRDSAHRKALYSNLTGALIEHGRIKTTVAKAKAVKPVAEKITFSTDVLFDFDRAVIKPDGQKKLDELQGRMKGVSVEVVIAIGHADRIGGDAYNQKLSVRRADAVKAYLVSKGTEQNRVYTEGKGEKQPVSGDKCKGMGDDRKNRKLLDCLQPDRRVDIEVIGTRAP